MNGQSWIPMPLKESRNTFRGWVAKYGEWYGNYRLVRGCLEWGPEILGSSVWWEYRTGDEAALCGFVRGIIEEPEGVKADVELLKGMPLHGCRFAFSGLTKQYRVEKESSGMMYCIAERITAISVAVIPVGPEVQP